MGHTPSRSQRSWQYQFGVTQTPDIERQRAEVAGFACDFGAYCFLLDSWVQDDGWFGCAAARLICWRCTRHHWQRSQQP